MAEHTTDDEQAEALKKWIDENGTSMLVTIVVAVVAVFGFQSWQNSVQETGESASGLYQDLIESVGDASPFAEPDPEQIQSSRYIADQLKTEYEGTTYAQFAALTLAKYDVDEGDLEGAEAELRWVLARSPDESIDMVTRVRLARVLLAAEKADDALAVLEAARVGDAMGHNSSYQEALGDVYLALERTDDARTAYQMAVDSMSENEAKPILEMKLEDLVTAPGGSEA